MYKSPFLLIMYNHENIYNWQENLELGLFKNILFKQNLDDLTYKDEAFIFI